MGYLRRFAVRALRIAQFLGRSPWPVDFDIEAGASRSKENLLPGVSMTL